MKIKIFNLRYRISTDGKDSTYPYKVERRVVFIWWKIFRSRSEEAAVYEIKKCIAQKHRMRKEIIREYTEQDYLADKIKNG